MAAAAAKRSRFGRLAITTLKYGLYLALLAFVALAVAVGIAWSSLPGRANGSLLAAQVGYLWGHYHVAASEPSRCAAPQ